MGTKRTFLTKAQIRVLKLRKSGLSQAEIAQKLGTSRANICSLEKRARQNIERAEKTLKLAEKLQAPVVLEIKPGEDIFESARRLLKTADDADIHVLLDMLALVTRIRENSKGKLRGRVAIEKIELALTSDGDVIVS